LSHAVAAMAKSDKTRSARIGVSITLVERTHHGRGSVFGMSKLALGWVSLIVLPLFLLGCGEDESISAQGSGGSDGGGGTAGSAGASDIPAAGEFLSVSPGEPTICSRGTPFRFFVVGGDPKKIIIDFRGGGACWNKVTCSIKDSIFSAEAPTEEAAKAAFATSGAGIYRLSDDRNPLKGWTLVHIPYCTGDVHWGDAVVDYDTNLKIHHKGFVNGQNVLGWIKERYQPEEILVTGCSAGAYGAIGHSAYVADAYPNAKITVVADSGCGVVTDDFFKNSFPNWNAQIPRQVPALKNKDILTLTIVDLYTAIGQAYPKMRISQQTTAFDDDQTFYYTVMGGAEADWSVKAMESLSKIEAATPNFRYYLSPGPLHCLHPYDSFFERKSDGTAYVDWLGQMLTAAAPPATVACSGAACKQDPICTACKAGTLKAGECSWCKDWTGN
jgi:hypothetical protein